MFKKYYLAYGSNLNLKEIMKRCPSARIVDSIILSDYILVYKGSADNYSYLTIEKCEGESIPMALYEMSLLDLAALDDYEGCPWLYFKSYVNVIFYLYDGKSIIYLINW